MKEASKVFIGGSGQLGRSFLRLHPEYLAPAHNEVDITNNRQVRDFIRDTRPACIVLAAAIVGKNEAEQNQAHTYRVNVGGVVNIVKACSFTTRLVYISSAAVFDGKKGNYNEEDIPNPQYFYGLTKLLGETAARTLNDMAIIRTDFFTPGQFKYNQVLSDHYCSRIPIDQLSRYLGRIAASNFRGLINVGQKRDTLFNILKGHVPNITPITRAQSSMPDFPVDLSLDTTLLNKLFPS